MGGRRDRPDDR